MPYYRYLVANQDIPEENIRAGDTIEIPLGCPEPIVSVRGHGFNHGRFLGYEADGLISPVDGVIGLPTTSRSAGAPRRPSEREQAESGPHPA